MPPGVRPVDTRNFPVVAKDRQVDTGCARCQSNVVRPAPVRGGPASSPMAKAVTPAGTVTWKSYVALSSGVSLQGYQPGEPCGSLTTKAPSGVLTQPSIEPSGSVTAVGTPLDRTTTVNPVPARSGTAGVTTSSWPSEGGWANEAGRPSTVTAETVRLRRRSRSKVRSGCVAVAVIVAVPSSRPVAGPVAGPVSRTRS